MVLVLGRTCCMALVLVGALLLSTGCREEADVDTPEQTVRAFIDRMQRVHGDPKKSRAAFELLSLAARDNLEQRAQRASAATGGTVRPEEMLAPSAFFLDFQPESWSTRSGRGWAVVTAAGKSPAQKREIRCVKEKGGWRVVLDLPELPPIEKRLP